MTKAPNAEQDAYWNDAAGAKWVSYQADLDAQIGPFGEATLDRVAPRVGERAIDVGCGCGETTLAIARRIGPAGRVLGVDLSSPMLARARERAAGSPGIAFERADAQTHRFEPEATDLLFSRFGVMFFADPVVAFANLRTALRPRGRLGFVCWQAIGENEWMSVPVRALGTVLTLPPADPLAPGPFAFADPKRVESVLGGAGFTGVVCEPFSIAMTLAGGGDLDAVTEFLLEIGPAARALREQGQHHRAAVGQAIRAAIAPHRTEAGVRMKASVWLVRAVRG